MKEWSWVKGGIALGLLSILAILLVKPLGVSTEYVVTDGILLKAIVPDFVGNNPYFAKYAAKLTIGYGWVLVAGMGLGAFLSVRLGGKRVSKEEKEAPSLWVRAFGDRPASRRMHAFLGGFLILFGARLAGGCTSGHIISGITQLSVSGFIFGAAVFLAGIPTALLLFRKVREA